MTQDQSQNQSNLNDSLSTTLTQSTSHKHSHGAIVRIRLENFMTYKEVELYPGPRLNVIIGPNGSGKSSIVCAICLGLAGHPRVIGRAGNIGDYIKTGNEKGMIEIELNNTERGSNWIVNRTLHTHSASKWTLNGKPTTETAIKDLMKNLHIQVDNLCQFLPQEKVAEFTNMSKCDLLENTEKCVGGEELYSLHKSLKTLGQETRTLEVDLNEALNQAATCKQALKHLEPDVQAIQGRKDLEAKIGEYTKCKYFRDYEEKINDHENVTKAFEAVKKKVEEVNHRLKPMQDQIKKSKVELEKTQTSFKAKYKESVDLKNKLNKDINAISEQSDDLIEKIRDELRHKKDEEKRRIESCKDVEQQINALEEQFDSMDVNSQDQEDLQAEWNKLEEERKRISEQQAQLSNKHQQVIDEVRRIQQDIQIKQRELDHINNVQETRLVNLQHQNPDAWKAVKWLRQNKMLFRKTVYEPMILSLNVNEPNMMKYVEFVIPKRDLLAMFIFEDTDDMELFIKECHEKQKLVVHGSAIPVMSLEEFRREATPIDNLKKYGMFQYVIDAVQGPDAILRYLCQTTKIHTLPIANDLSMTKMDDITKDEKIRRFFVKNFCYSLSISYYTKEPSTTNVHVQKEKYLTDSVSHDRKQKLEQEHQQMKDRCNELQKSQQAYEKEQNGLSRNLDDVKARKIAITDKRNMKAKLERKIEEKKHTLNTYKKKQIDIEKEEKIAHEKEMKIHEDKMHKLNAQVKELENFNKKCNLMIIDSGRVALARQQNLQAVGKLEIYNDELTQLKEKTINSKKRLEMSEASTRLAAQKVVKSLDKTLPPDNIVLPNKMIQELRTKFADFPKNLADLESEIMNFNAQLSCQGNIKDDVIRVYQLEKAKLTQFENRIHDLEIKIKQGQITADTSKNKWLNEVNTMIHEINEKFVDLFNTMGCKGQVCLDIPESAKDFEKYGVNIKVQFRDGEKLHEMSEFLQSGGEKSVSVMLYMIALQNMTICPFRCVDEINQGMDPTNERRVFELLVRHSSDKANSQYFLLSPKLLPNLKYSRKIKLLFVCNGDVNIKSQEWNVAKYIERRRALANTQNN
ncbi:unnamed protein product [Rotaria socialis]|uniref:Structural maintenance of chromosomes protein 5 n=1 Tax=Rotaria socialis TaxID=392032 RepID=A0A818U0K2_9BILA|nr:unnamed protein product [Rotaria socialis]CAF4470240.1 unnamed protein product [Rotaria socialis]